MLPLLGLLLIGTITAGVCVQLTQAAPHASESTPPTQETQPTSPPTEAAGDTTQSAVRVRMQNIFVMYLSMPKRMRLWLLQFFTLIRCLLQSLNRNC